MKTFLTPLNAEEEAICLKQMKDGDLEAKDILIERNLRLVAHIAKKYQNTEEDMEDLISIGTVGLMKAVLTYNDKRGSKLATYAARCIENELLMYLRSKKKTQREISLYEPIGTDSEGNQMRLLDIMDADETDLFLKVELSDNIKKLYANLDRVLTKREAQIIRLRYGLDYERPFTQREIARKFDISRSYVSRLEKKALEKLRAEFEKTEK
ncbi:MAG: RNA polymerase sporulation sigma factor SigK [Lachnospiraceae bacterium]